SAALPRRRHRRAPARHELLPRQRATHPAARSVEEGRDVDEHFPQEDFCGDVEKRAERDRVLPATAQPCCGARNADRVLRSEYRGEGPSGEWKARKGEGEGEGEAARVLAP